MSAPSTTRWSPVATMLALEMGMNASTSSLQTGVLVTAPTPRMMDSLGMGMGAAKVSPKPPKLVTVAMPPVLSSGASLRRRAWAISLL